ncbi:MAG: hypothetical protein IPI73_23455 [Betaproteobacteria bacterium]|nr:hypothetical protein [Betaproteobacteria bacterium]
MLGPSWIALAGFKTQISLMLGEIAFTPMLDNFRELLFRARPTTRNFRNSLITPARAR